ncbi:hypothetical protein GALMADRAFT_260311 [Galerina marginata CBS 339.88]|uniref:Uncharacterized protein n=1 Tax=Galerina marginata (strain CBS 339.88) TaxID=685588 RepID=A0A067S2Z2_GALM3|nr:hypothetical protein GALMADRAFT_260311 [Galerina marginata CBS 339.88]
MPPAKSKGRAHARQEKETSGEDFDLQNVTGSSSSDVDQAGIPAGFRLTKNTQVDIPGPNASAPELRKALYAMHVSMDEREIENKKLQDRIHTLEAQVNEMKKSKEVEGTSKARRPVGDPEDDRIALHGRKFGIMNEPFVPDAAFLAPQPDCTSVDPARYSTPETALEGVIAELYEEIPEDLHEKLLNLTRFRDTFLSKLNDHRRHAVGQLRNQSAAIIFNKNPHYFSTSFKDRDKLPDFVAALKFPDPRKSKFSKYAPILFPDGRKDMTKFLKCIHLALMLRCLLFGPASLSSEKKPSGSKPVGELWGITRVTPGSIAFVAILAIFLHSPDNEFSEIGKLSKIDYKKLFQSYKQILITNLVAQKKQYVELLEWFNIQVFPWSRQGKISPDDDDSSGIEDAQGGGGTDDDAQVTNDNLNWAPTVEHTDINAQQSEMTPARPAPALPAPPTPPSDTHPKDAEAVAEQFGTLSLNENQNEPPAAAKSKKKKGMTGEATATRRSGRTRG